MNDALRVLLRQTRVRQAATQTESYEAKYQLLRAACHPRQGDLVDDDSKRIVGLVGRGGGKTTAVVVRLLRQMLLTPRARCLFFATTRRAAEDLVWQPLKKFCAHIGLVEGVDVSYNETKLRLSMCRTGAQLTLVGCDNRKTIEQHRGMPFHEVWIDEAASHAPRLLGILIDEIITPRLGDYNGTLGLVSTPSSVLRGRFYELTRRGTKQSRPYGQRDSEDFAGWDGWSCHAWTVEDGAKAGIPAIQAVWAHALKVKARNQWSDDNPKWKREYKGQWAADDTENVFRFRPYTETGERWNLWTPQVNKHTGLAELPVGSDEWFYVVGMDMGHSDPFALQVFAFREAEKRLYHVYERVQKGMTIKEIAILLIGEDLDAMDPGGLVEALGGWPARMVADTAGLGGAILEELSKVYGVRIAPAEKKNKHDAIEMFNGDLVDGRIWVLEGSELAVELGDLQWEERPDGRLQEAKGQPNHSSDAAIYARREAWHLLGEDAARPKARRTEQEHWNHEMATLEETEQAVEWTPEWTPDEPPNELW